MTYFTYEIPQNPNPQYSNEGGKHIDINVFFPHLNRTVRYTCGEIDCNCGHSEEIFKRAKSGEFGPIAHYVKPPEPKIPDYYKFWDAFIATDIYTQIRDQSMKSLVMNTLNTEFIALISDAKFGRPNEQAIQKTISEILNSGDFTNTHINELKNTLNVGNLKEIYRV